MNARIATGLARTDAGVDSFAEAAARAALQLRGAPADLAVVFAGAANLGHAEEGLAAVQARLHARALLGCGAQGLKHADTRPNAHTREAQERRQH
jgi:small ligand-binding sensory domain FIST